MSDIKTSITFLILTLSIVNGAEFSSCTLPGTSTTSSCMSIRKCPFFDKFLKKFQDGSVTNQDRSEIRKYLCPGQSTFLCCPNSVSPAISIPNTTIGIPTSSIRKSDLNKIKSHPNLALLNDKRCGFATARKLVGGWEADYGQFPWMALLKFGGFDDEKKFSIGCGGSLISRSFVLTAAHCITRRVIGVRLGEHDITSERDCDLDGFCLDPVQDIPVVKRIRHENYERGIRQHDIALLKLERPADLAKNNVNTVCLPTTEGNQLESLESDLVRKMSVMGWGNIESGKPSNVLMTANIPFVSHADCVERFKNHDQKIFDGNFCSGGFNATDTCRGDSGGPIQNYGLVNDKTRAIQYGVLSGGVECNQGFNEFFPGIFTDISYYLEWILNNMN